MFVMKPIQVLRYSFLEYQMKSMASKSKLDLDMSIKIGSL